MRKVIAAICLAAVVLSPACGRNKPPNSLFDAAGYHVRADKVYYLNALPGKPFEIGPVSTAGGPYAADSAHVYWMGKTIDGADPLSFLVLDAAFECSADAQHAYYRQTVIAGADPFSFRADRPVTNCDEMSISFAD